MNTLLRERTTPTQLQVQFRQSMTVLHRGPPYMELCPENYSKMKILLPAWARTQKPHGRTFAATSQYHGFLACLKTNPHPPLGVHHQ